MSFSLFRVQFHWDHLVDTIHHEHNSRIDKSVLTGSPFGITGLAKRWSRGTVYYILTSHNNIFTFSCSPLKRLSLQL